MAMDERGLGKIIQSARQKAGLTQQQLCQHANLSFSTLTKIERGAIKSPSIFTIQSIAGALGLSLDELLGKPKPVKTYKKTKSGVGFIFFDVNDCLIHYYQRAFPKIADLTGTPSDIVETAYWHDNNAACRGDMTMDEYNAKLAQRLGVEGINWADYYMEAIEPVEEIQEVLKWAAENYRIGLISNIMPGFLPTLRRNKVLPDLPYEVIIDSSEVHHLKPEPEIYQIAQEKTGCQPSEILLIDDSRPNLAAAEQQGWNVLSVSDARAAESAERIRQVLEPAA